MPQQIGDGTAAIAPYRVLCWSLTAIWLSISLAESPGNPGACENPPIAVEGTAPAQNQE